MIDLSFFSQECFWQLEQKNVSVDKIKGKMIPCMRSPRQERKLHVRERNASVTTGSRVFDSIPRVRACLVCCDFFDTRSFLLYYVNLNVISAVAIILVLFFFFAFLVFRFFCFIYFFVFHSRMFFGDQKRKACLLISIKSLNDGT